MSKLAYPLAALALCYALFFTYLGMSYAEMPLRVANHFDIYGRANGWMSRDACVAFSIGLGILMPGIIVGTMAGTGKIPVSFINLPHRDYWLAPERHQAAVAVLLRFALWFACLNVLFVTGLHWAIVQANLPGNGAHLAAGGIGAVAGGFFGGTAIWVILLLRRFSKIK